MKLIPNFGKLSLWLQNTEWTGSSHIKGSVPPTVCSQFKQNCKQLSFRYLNKHTYVQCYVFTIGTNRKLKHLPCKGLKIRAHLNLSECQLLWNSTHTTP